MESLPYDLQIKIKSWIIRNPKRTVNSKAKPVVMSANSVKKTIRSRIMRSREAAMFPWRWREMERERGRESRGVVRSDYTVKMFKIYYSICDA